VDLKSGNKERIILEVAEKLFIEKGLTGTRTTEISSEAGVNHALLHYYFRTKENLFEKIFEQKAGLLLGSFSFALDDDTPFLDKLKNAVESHFEILRQAPKMPLFIIREIVLDKDRKDFI
jgi:AcrR family transcriptional regulator